MLYGNVGTGASFRIVPLYEQPLTRSAFYFDQRKASFEPCDLAEEGKLAGAILRRDGDLVFRFSSYWRIVAERRRTKPDVRLPFFHLRTEGVWKPLEVDGRPAEDRSRAVLAQLDVSFLVCLSNPDFRMLARRTLIARYFEPHERAELYSLVGLEVPPDDIVAADASRFLRSEESEAKRDAKFSVRVLPAYDYTCALTRYRMIAVDGTTPLDAAHIHQFKKGGSNHPTNGIALSKTAHWLFDHGFWSSQTISESSSPRSDLMRRATTHIYLKNWLVAKYSVLLVPTFGPILHA